VIRVMFDFRLDTRMKKGDSSRFMSLVENGMVTSPTSTS
jgi:hypothetical protein